MLDLTMLKEKWLNSSRSVPKLNVLFHELCPILLLNLCEFSSFSVILPAVTAALKNDQLGRGY